ncbi:hypothetical protein ZORO111903_10175 [Zobellia roscoffensis]|uniref:hypothetical protein n=1 Tax=Zobellia roscoffensis TaxID=2779508 RepID=UPI00188C2DD0|nr:hypothetical protein [Zobellia roscoffensis]
MKKFRLLPLALSLVFLFGCSSDDSIVSQERETAQAKEASLKSAGASAKDLLSNDTFSKLLIEIAYVDGFKPTDEAIEGFTSYLKERTFKEEIELKYTKLASPDEESLTLEEIAELESDNRTVYNDGSTLGLYIYFADAPAEGDEEEEGLVTLGAVYRNTSMIIHEVTARKLADQSFFITDADVENSTLNHEFGHLFGLVNLGTAPVNDHEDIERDADGKPVLDKDGNTNGNNHCSIEGCLMRAELQFGGFSNKAAKINSYEAGITAACRLSGKDVLRMLEAKTSKGLLPEPPSLDVECLLDLHSVGGR